MAVMVWLLVLFGLRGVSGIQTPVFEDLVFGDPDSKQEDPYGPKAHCKHQEWTIPDWPGEIDPADRTIIKPWVIFRGQAFRTSAELQDQALCSVSRHVIRPMKAAFKLTSLHVHFCLRPHTDNQQLKNRAEKYFGVPSGDISLLEVSEQEQPLQPDMYQHCLQDVPDSAGFVLVLRPDLVFHDNLRFERSLSPDKLYFQWNLFQCCANREVADQIQLIGGTLIREVKQKWNSTEMGGGIGSGYYDTMHMMYNWAETALGKRHLGYLNYYPVENCFFGDDEYPQWNKYGHCKQRGNTHPKKHAGTWNVKNPLFEYDRYVSADPSSSCD
jgi:hypothetical protein